MRRKDPDSATEIKNASALRVGIVVSNYNSDVTGTMLDGALSTLNAWQVKDKNVIVLKVSGSFEIPFACLKLIKKKVDAIIALGCIVKGETRHDEYIASAVAHGIMRLSLDHTVPISFGVLTTNTLKQAHDRSRGENNKGNEAAVAALQSALL